MKNEVYIISKAESDYKKMLEESLKHSTPPPPPPPPSVYGTNNFIIDKDTTIFYFQRPYFFVCNTGWEDNHPPFLFGFEKEDFIEIPKNSIQDFILLNFKGGVRNNFDIASQLDTLNFTAYYNLINTLKQCKLERDKDRIVIRKTTQEEDTVIAYKKKRKPYYYGNIKWDTTRIDTITYKFLRRPK
ncbi:hypothetical protein J2X31_000924 [Flavobacterium arsenatis]|uniref:Uncharacterized protein n=1 Tax=Flavobacterium arsenatis TaxID=1484332 RepID=A0ABU1TLT0_9FLAO|nr:hypothetical protein [Flavobacterium arsenatis]MDR6966924.1 hypothetical protein [Flavobacterium arsenatis]